MTFRFRLEKILHWTRLKEMVKKMELAGIFQRIGYLKARRNELETSLRDLLGKSHGGGAALLSEFYDAKIALDSADWKRLGGELVKEEAAAAKKRSELDRIFRRKKALEALREKRLAEWRTDQARKDQRRLDDAYALSSRLEINSEK